MSRALYYDPSDGRPDTGLAPFAWATPASLVGGVATMVGVPLITALFFFVFAVGLAAHLSEELLDEDEDERLLEEEDVIEARFVVLGRDFEDELPNRIVPRLSTAPPQPSNVPTENTPVERAEPEERPEEEPPPDAVEDVLARIGDRAQAFAEIAEEREREGSPDGIEEGTETTATEGDIYRGRLFSFFRRGWSVPTTLDRDEVQGMRVSVTVQIGPDLQIASFNLRGTSGNALFDQSVNEQLTRLQAAQQPIPPPPEEVADQYIGQSIVVRFNGRQAG